MEIFSKLSEQITKIDRNNFYGFQKKITKKSPKKISKNLPKIFRKLPQKLVETFF